VIGGSPNERKSLAFSAEFHRKLLNERYHDWRFIRLFDSQFDRTYTL
jgi:hypothetical protein